MATITNVRHLCDLEKAAGREVEADHIDKSLMIDGKSYTLDLADKNYRLLRETLDPFISAARRSRSPRATTTPTQNRGQTRAIREWAEQAGFPIANRGRIPSEVMDKWRSRDEPSTSTNGHAPAPVAVATAPVWTPPPPPPPHPKTKKPAPEPAAPPRFRTKADLNKAVREWSAGKGHPLAPRGKVPSEVMATYVHHHGEPVVEG